MEAILRYFTIFTLIFILTAAAYATSEFFDVFKKTYKPKSGTAIAKAGCSVCHVSGDYEKFNPYGTALKGKPKTAKSLKSIEKLDSDKDGFSNIKEIKAGTLPGDKNSKPKS